MEYVSPSLNSNYSMFVITDSKNTSLRIELNDNDMWLTDYGREVLGFDNTHENDVPVNSSHYYISNETNTGNKLAHTIEIDGDKFIIMSPGNTTTEYGNNISEVQYSSMDSTMF